MLHNPFQFLPNRSIIPLLLMVSFVGYLMAFMSHAYAQGTALPAYRDSQQTIPTRVKDLLKRMTPAEKVGQLLCPMGWEMYDKQGTTVTVSDTFKTLIDHRHIGMFWAVYRADPWTKKTLETGLNPRMAAEAGNAMQRYVMTHSRLGIPLFIAEEMPHGHMAIGTTVFPTGIGLAATWNPALVEKVAAAAAKEVRLQGGHIGYGPVLDLARDPRWSRVEEGFGEDPVLSAAMGAAFVRGTGAGKLDKAGAVITTLKHFAAYGVPEGAHNGRPALIGERSLREAFLPPFKAAIDAGALSVMTSYNSIDGIPCTANSLLLKDILRDEWGFKGFVVSDLFSIDGLADSHRITKDLKESAVKALNAGVDVDLGSNAYQTLLRSLEAGGALAAAIDTAVSRVLRLKFAMGLFENPYVDPEQAAHTVRNDTHVALAREAARQSVVLLENKNNILPLSKQLNRISVIGPNAHTPYNQLGDYTAPQDESHIITVLEGIRDKVPEARVSYVKGCAIRDTSDLTINEAVASARQADVAIVVLGGSSARDFKTEYLETGAASTKHTAVNDIENGEGFDRATLEPLGKQLELLQAVVKTGTPTVVLYIQGRPLNMNWAAANAGALLTAWYPGEQGGSAIADVLFGDYNPSGRLPISVPRHVGQLPVYYNQQHPAAHDYVDEKAAPLYPFGYGQSYSTFVYDSLVIGRLSEKSVQITCQVSNESEIAGDEVIQLYLHDHQAAVVQPIKQLKQFQRIHLRPGESKSVTFVLTEQDLTIIDRDMNEVTEPGEFTVMVGVSSADIRLHEVVYYPFLP